MRSLFRSLFLAFIFVAVSARMVAGETIWFLVGEPPGRVRLNDSYVLPLSKQEDIDHARYLISLGASVFSGTYQALVVANVVAATNDINRNFLDTKFPKWSWQVDEFHSFSDFTAEELDGGPTQLEEDFDWSRGGEATIGFWAYTVVRELGPVPLYLSIIPEREDLQFYWSSPGTNNVYTLEGKESLVSTNWVALPGAVWPLKTNHWSVALTNSPAPFYRVKAEQSNP